LSSRIKIITRKTKNQLHNTDHKVADGIYAVAGTLAGWRSQLTIAAGSGAGSLQISLRFGIMVLKHMFTTALDKTI
jgi:hypothetical protein